MVLKGDKAAFTYDGGTRREIFYQKEADRGYPVKARGTVTALMDGGFFFQDSTRSIYVEYKPEPGADRPQRGDCWEVEGTTFAMFAPNIRAKKAVRLGAGTLPDPSTTCRHSPRYSKRRGSFLLPFPLCWW